MWKQKIGISVGARYEKPAVEVIEMLKKIGFDAVSLEWGKGCVPADAADKALEVGLEIQSLHAPFNKSDDMWSEDEAISEPAIIELFSALDFCKEYKIPVMVMHTWIGFDYDENPTQKGLENYGRVVDKAAEYGVKIAFENTEGKEFLDALMEHFKDNDTVGFCWDSGHEMCYNYSEDLLAQYGDRLIMTHINDNLGISDFNGRIYWTDDLHLLPFDGIGDWDENVLRLKKSRKIDVLNFELCIGSKPDRHENDIYGEMGLEKYFTEAYKRACRIAYKYSK